MDQTINLLQYLRGSSEVEINNLDIVVKYKDAIGKPNMYFVCGLGEKGEKRCSDNDIKAKKYFVVDIDMRLNHFEKTGEVLDQKTMLSKFNSILLDLQIDGFGDYCAIVDSGNGIHLYYSGNERAFEPQTYSNGVKYFYEKINQTLAKHNEVCDPATSNLARIMRLPGSINPRKKQRKNKETKENEILWDLGNKVCEILYFEEKNSIHFEKIEEYAKLYEEEKQKEKEMIQQVKTIARQNHNNTDIRSEINQIPIQDIVYDVRGVQTKNTRNGGEVITLDEGHKNMGAYIYTPHNVVVNTGSSMIKNNDKKTFTCYELIYYELMGQDGKATVEYFEKKYGIKTQRENKTQETIEIQYKPYEKEGYLYPNSTFDAFDCIMSGELVTIVAESNSGKTSFAMDIMQKNSQRGKKCFYINLEFAIETMRQSRWLYINNKKKRNLTDIEPLSEHEKQAMNDYVQNKLKQFDYHNEPKGMSISEIVELILQKQKEGYGLFVLDTFSRITGNLDSKIARTSQNKSMEILQELCHKTGVCIINLHHTNKKGEFEGSQKIMDLSNVFIMMKREEDMGSRKTTTFTLTKDKFVNKIELETYYINQQYTLSPPKDPF